MTAVGPVASDRQNMEAGVFFWGAFHTNKNKRADEG